jgi:toxin CcdB
MARFDVHRFRSRTTPLVVDVQADLLSDLSSRVVVPLVPIDHAEKEGLAQLKPRMHIAGKDYILMTTDLAALPVERLGAHVANLEGSDRDVVTNALDFLFFGF